ncbi:MAG: rRNA maturation RNase YbeY [Thermodesulfobacteriota bacterium]
MKGWKRDETYRGDRLTVTLTDRIGAGGKRKITRLAVKILKELSIENKELSILITDDREIRSLNRKYLGKDLATDVLSFPMEDSVLIGDVVVSLETAEKQAKRFSVTTTEELARLIVHGVLHLMGYEHVNGGRQAGKMKRKERELLTVLTEDGLI